MSRVLPTRVCGLFEHMHVWVCLVMCPCECVSLMPVYFCVCACQHEYSGRYMYLCGRVHLCLCPGRQCLCVSVPDMTQRVNWTQEAEREQAHGDASERICRWFLINLHGTQQMPVLISHRELCWFGGWAFLSTTVALGANYFNVLMASTSSFNWHLHGRIARVSGGGFLFCFFVMLLRFVCNWA